MPQTIPSRFFSNARRFGSRTVIVDAADAWRPVSWSRAAREVAHVAAGLAALGVEPGDRVAIACRPRAEALFVDLAAQLVGAVSAAVYPTWDADTAARSFARVGARVCVVDDGPHWEALREHASRVSSLEHVVVVDRADDDTIGYAELLERGRAAPIDVDALLEAASPVDAAVFAFTSGTTGAPRAAMLTHAGVEAAARGMGALGVRANEVVLSALPLASPLGRAVAYATWWHGAALAHPSDALSLYDDLARGCPDVLAAAPPVWSQLYRDVCARAGDSPGARWVLDWARGLGAQSIARARTAGRASLGLRLQQGLARRIVFAPLRAQLGGRLRHGITGGAPVLRPAVALLEATGITIDDVWSAAEMGVATALNRSGAGTLGMSLPGVSTRRSDDGELCVRSPGVFAGYADDPAATAAAFTPDGWLRTGDIARPGRPRGYQAIDRKHDLIVTRAGVQIAPDPVESQLRADPRILDAVLIGDGRPHVTLLVSVARTDDDEPAPNASAHVVEDAVARINVELRRDEQIRGFRLLPYALSEATGELAPSGAVRRDVVLLRFGYLIDEMYDDPSGQV